MLQDNQIHASKVRQNNQEFLVGIFSIKQILSFTKYTERLIVYFDDDNKPEYNKQVQRKVETSRVEKIADFLIDDPDALFPTNIVLSIPNAAIEVFEEQQNGIISITIDRKVFSELKRADGDVYLTIIDGQHRIRGIEKAIERLESEILSLRQLNPKGLNEEFNKKLIKKSQQLNSLLNIELVVTFFIDASLEFQAMVFSTINRTQKSVPQSLVTSLFGLTEKDTPQKTALEIVLALNGFEKSPFFNRIKLHGGTYERNQSPPLTQATMVKSIIELISVNLRDSEKDRFRDRDELKINCGPSLPFRIYYANNQDQFITDILFSYFSAARKTFVDGSLPLWDFQENTKPQNILHTTVGYQALLKLLVDILRVEKDDSRRDKVDIYIEYLQHCSHLNFEDQQRYPFTSISKTILYLDMSLAIWPAKDNDSRIERLREALKKR